MSGALHADTAGQKGDAPQAADLIEGLPRHGPTQPMTLIIFVRPSPPRGHSPSFQTTLPARSTTCSTSIALPSVISSDAASQAQTIPARCNSLRKKPRKTTRPWFARQQALVKQMRQLSRNSSPPLNKVRCACICRGISPIGPKGSDPDPGRSMSDKPARFVRLAGGRCFPAKTLDCTPVRRVGWSTWEMLPSVARDNGLPLGRCGHLSHP